MAKLEQVKKYGDYRVAKLRPKEYAVINKHGQIIQLHGTMKKAETEAIKFVPKEKRTLPAGVVVLKR